MRAEWRGGKGRAVGQGDLPAGRRDAWLLPSGLLCGQSPGASWSCEGSALGAFGGARGCTYAAFLQIGVRVLFQGSLGGVGSGRAS